jgi:hypothetical protein
MKPLFPSSLLLVLGVAAAVSTTPAHAQGHSHGTTITLFSKPYFRGESLTLHVGDKWDDLNHVRFTNGRRANNRVSSILIEGRARVTLFDFRGFEGESITLTRSVSHLSDLPQYRNGDWDNALSSLTVRSGGRRNAPVTCAPNPGDYRGGHDDYGHSRGGGNSGYGYSSGHRPEPNGPYAGDNRVKRTHLDRETARVVRRAYQDVLGREPDVRGLANYVRIMQHRGWSETRLRKELRRSSEYRTVVVPRLVNNAYHDVLDRSPDSAGLRFYSSRMIHHGWTEQRVRAALKDSPEYAGRMRDKARHTPGKNWG